MRILNDGAQHELGVSSLVQPFLAQDRRRDMEEIEHRGFVKLVNFGTERGQQLVHEGSGERIVLTGDSGEG